jgi:hypothetical protein
MSTRIVGVSIFPRDDINDVASRFGLMPGEFPSSVNKTHLRAIPMSDHDAQSLSNEIGNILRGFLHSFILLR